MIEHVRIAVLDAYDHVIAYLDNSAPKALHYYDDELHEYLNGTAYTFSFCAGAKHEDSQHLVVGNKLSFVRGDKEYYLNIMSARQDEYKIEVEAYSLSFELLNEEKEAYKAEKAMSLKEYLSIFDFERVLTLGNNEVSDKSIKHEWTGTDTLLARVFSLCNVFSAEAEFVIQLNDNYSLNKIVLNVYQEHSDTVQGVGVKRTDIILRYGKNVTGITKTAEITGLYTAIRPTGKDGLTVADLDKKEYDADGNLEYYTSKGSRNILAPQARDRFPSNLMSGENDRYIAKIWSYETDNVNMLYGQALAELKKNCIPQVKYEVNGFFDTNIGDTVSIEDDQYIPTLYLEARVTEQVRSFTDRTRNKTTFDNFKEVQDQLDPSLVAKMNALIEQNKTYTCMISTDNGTTFKNNIGSTTLTASVRDGANDVTDNFSINWKKDEADLATGKSITVNAADVDGKALYRFDAKDSSGNVKGFYEVTVTDVSDGKDGANGADGTSSYTHIKYSDDGEIFTQPKNYVSKNRADWVSGYYGSGSTTDDSQPNASTTGYNTICENILIPIDTSKRYKIRSGNDAVKMHCTIYKSDGTYKGRTTTNSDSYGFASDVSSVRVSMECTDKSLISSLDSWDALFASGEISPIFAIDSEEPGDNPGAWMGTMTSDSPVASTNFNDYTWVKIKGEDGEPTGITESAEEPAEKYVGMLWKNTGTTSGLVQGATYRWNGESWEMYKFSADNIEAQTFKGYTFDGSIFKSDFAEMDGSLTRYVGTMHIQNGRIKIECERQVRSSEESDWMVSSNNSIELNYDGFVIHDDGETAYLTLNDLKSLYSLLACHTFVTEKEYKVGTWIGGKPIYRRVFTLDALASSTNAVDLSGMDVEHLFFDLSHSNYETSNHIFPVVKTTTTSATDSIAPSQAEIYFEKNTKVLKFKAGSNVGDGTLYLTVEYTKTTD